ncbi:MAG: ATP synthase F1 subunit epsilon [Lachnospiraceae bacterium]|nr:ATP synthase F1 subunit epsilon [Lachnospiraceae bacterium]
MAETANTFEVKVITPERVFYEGVASMIEFTTTEGDIGVYAHHIPLTTVLAPGVVTITEDEENKKTAGVYSGFAEIQGDKVTLLAEAAEWPDEIDVARAEAAEKRARERIEAKASDLDLVRAETALRKALVRKTLAGRER